MCLTFSPSLKQLPWLLQVHSCQHHCSSKHSTSASLNNVSSWMPGEKRRQTTLHFHTNINKICFTMESQQPNKWIERLIFPNSAYRHHFHWGSAACFHGFTRKQQRLVVSRGSRQNRHIFPVLCGFLQECALSVSMEKHTEILTVARQSLMLSGWVYRPPHCKRIK